MARPLAVLAALAAFGCAGTALASEPFPEAIRADLDLGAAPGCALCHRAEEAPVGAADKPFALSAKARGMVADDLSALAKALDQMRSDGVDSDGDGAQDLDELWWGGDPNQADLPAGGTQDPPSYGCSASARGAGGGPGAIPLLGMIALLVARRGRATG